MWRRKSSKGDKINKKVREKQKNMETGKKSGGLKNCLMKDYFKYNDR